MTSSDFHFLVFILFPVCACVYACLYIRVCVYRYACVGFVCVCTCVPKYHACMYMCEGMHACEYHEFLRYVCMSVCLYVCEFVCVCVFE